MIPYSATLPVVGKNGRDTVARVTVNERSFIIVEIRHDERYFGRWEDDRAIWFNLDDISLQDIVESDLRRNLS